MTDIMFAIIISLMIDGWAVSSKAKNRREMSDAIAASLLKRALGQAASSQDLQQQQNSKKSKKKRTWQGFVASIGSLSELSLVEDSFKKLKEGRDGRIYQSTSTRDISASSSSSSSSSTASSASASASSSNETNTVPTLEVYGITKEHLDLVETRLREYETSFVDVETEIDTELTPNKSWSLFNYMRIAK
jgi:hypothetical protein